MKYYTTPLHACRPSLLLFCFNKRKKKSPCAAVSCELSPCFSLCFSPCTGASGVSWKREEKLRGWKSHQQVRRGENNNHKTKVQGLISGRKQKQLQLQQQQKKQHNRNWKKRAAPHTPNSIAIITLL